MELPSITFSGLATGLDTGEMVKQLVQVERIPMQRLARRKGDYDKQAKKLTGIKGKLDALKESAAQLDRAAEVLKSKTVVGDETVLTASAEGGASLGKYDVSITKLAKEERMYSKAFGAKDQTGLFGSGSFTITMDGDVTNISVSASDTLESVASTINSSAANVTAGIIYDGSSYFLQVRGNEAGLANALTFAETGTTLGLHPGTGGTEAQAADDATFTVDTFPMTRSTNVISDAIPGVSLTLLKETGTTSVEIQRDPDAIEAALNDFISKYNAVQKAINDEFVFLGEARGGDSLAGDSTLRSIQGKVRNVAISAVNGLSGDYSALSQIGVESNTDGTLKLNSTALEEALATNSDAVADVMIKNLDTGTTGVMELIQDEIDEFTRSGDGILTMRIKGIDSRKDEIDTQILRMQERVDAFEVRLNQQFAGLEQMISGLQSQQQQMMAMMGSL